MQQVKCLPKTFPTFVKNQFFLLFVKTRITKIPINNTRHSIIIGPDFFSKFKRKIRIVKNTSNINNYKPYIQNKNTNHNNPRNSRYYFSKLRIINTFIIHVNSIPYINY